MVSLISKLNKIKTTFKGVIMSKLVLTKENMIAVKLSKKTMSWNCFSD